MNSAPHVLRRVCACGNEYGRIESRNGQDCVFCDKCSRWQYNAPKTETGRAIRSVTSVHNGIKPGQRARILMRSNGLCELCGKGGESAQLHVGHIISVDAGIANGLTELQLNDDENLCTLCAECNLGISSEPMPLKFVIRILLIRQRFLGRAP